MKDGWDQYAAQKRIKQKGYLRKYTDGGLSWKTPETSRSDSVKCCREIEQEEKITEGKANEEELRHEESSEAHQERRKRVQRDGARVKRDYESGEGSDKRRCKAEKAVNKKEVAMAIPKSKPTKGEEKMSVSRGATDTVIPKGKMVSAGKKKK